MPDDQGSQGTGPELVKVQVDETMCIGAGQCEMYEDETFLVDDDSSIAAVVGTGLLPRDRAEQVIDTCPSRAISIAETTPAKDATSEEQT